MRRYRKQGMTNSELLVWMLNQGIPAGNCLDWPKPDVRGGYGQLMYHGEIWSPQRLIWTLSNGPIPEGIKLLHSCDRTSCFFLGHLRLGTHQENMDDKVIRKRTRNLPVPWDHRKEILRLYKLGKSNIELANMFKYSHRTIRRITSGQERV